VVLAFAELATFSFIYGVDRLCKDIGEREHCDREIIYAIKYSFPQSSCSTSDRESFGEAVGSSLPPVL
jgi:hypothetical protein